MAYQDSRYLDADNWSSIALAAAYARNGKFSEAIQQQKKCIALLKKNKKLSPSYKERFLERRNEQLNFYLQGRPYVDKNDRKRPRIRKRTYNERANEDIKNAFTAAQAYFIDFPDDAVTINKLKEVGFQLSKDVTLTVLKGNMKNLKMTAAHINGNLIYIVDHTGEITRRLKQNFDDDYIKNEEEELKKHCALYPELFKQLKTVEASHILIKVASDADTETVAKAKAKAEEVFEKAQGVKNLPNSLKKNRKVLQKIKVAIWEFLEKI